jgi:hypothetical protein
MKTHPLFSSDRRRKFAFEIERAYIAPAVIARLLSQVEFVTDIQRRKMFSAIADVHLSFNYNGRPYIVWKPYGDRTRFWIGPAPDAERDIDITPIETIFRCYRPPFHRTVSGKILRLRFPIRFLRGRPS